MKQTKVLLKSFSSLVLLLSCGVFMAALGFNCSGVKPLSMTNTSSGAYVTQVAADVPTRVGFLSSEQMLKSMIASTGTEGLGELTNSSDELIDRTYSEKTGMLPSIQNINQATGPTIIAVTNLASTVCAKAVDRDSAIAQTMSDQRLFFKEFDFSSGLAQQNSDAVSLAFERIARNAWRRTLASEDTEAIIAFSQEFSAGANTTNPAETRKLALAICTAALSSIDALTY